METSKKSRYAVLGLLAQKPRTGYDISSVMRKITNHFWQESDAAIYPILKQLLSEGKTTCEELNVDTGRPKKVYSITEAGLAECRKWLKQPATIIRYRDEMMLKIFCGAIVPREIMKHHIEARRTALRETAQMLASHEPYMHDNINKTPSALHEFLTFRAAQHSIQAGLQWCDEALLLLNDKE